MKFSPKYFGSLTYRVIYLVIADAPGRQLLLLGFPSQSAAAADAATRLRGNIRHQRAAKRQK